MATAAQTAPWQWGALRLEPRLSVRSLGYNENVFASAEGETATADVSAVAGGGLAAYLKLGGKSYVSAYLTPEYTWWRELEDLREFNLNYGLGLFGTYNRLQLAVQGSSTERERPLSSELEVPVQVLVESVSVDARMDLRPRLAVVAIVGTTETRYSEAGAEALSAIRFRELESDIDRFEAGLALTLRNGVEIGLGVENSQTDFLLDPGGRSNDGTSPLIRLSYDGRRFVVDVRAVARQLEFANPLLGRFEQETGSALVGVDLAAKTRLTVYGARDLVFGTTVATSTIDDTRWGIALARNLARRTEVRMFAEQGTAQYRDVIGPNAFRLDDLEAFGIDISLELGQWTAVSLRVSEVAYDSNLAGFDRSTSRFGIGLDLKEDLLPW